MSAGTPARSTYDASFMSAVADAERSDTRSAIRRCQGRGVVEFVREQVPPQTSDDHALICTLVTRFGRVRRADAKNGCDRNRHEHEHQG